MALCPVGSSEDKKGQSRIECFDPGFFCSAPGRVQLLENARAFRIFNVAGAPTDWNIPVGEPLPVEIVPLVKPYALWTGNVFRGVITCGGKPVPGAKVRIEYMNHDIV
jgi:hypothetical protein